VRSVVARPLSCCSFKCSSTCRSQAFLSNVDICNVNTRQLMFVPAAPPNAPEPGIGTVPNSRTTNPQLATPDPEPQVPHPKPPNPNFSGFDMCTTHPDHERGNPRKALQGLSRPRSWSRYPVFVIFWRELPTLPGKCSKNDI